MARQASEHLALDVNIHDDFQAERELTGHLRRPFREILRRAREQKIEARKVAKARRGWAKGTAGQ